MKRRSFLGLSTTAVAGAFCAGSSVMGNPADNKNEGNIKKENPVVQTEEAYNTKPDNEHKGLYQLTPDYERRLHQADKWFSRARLGMFHHWGLFTGGGILLNPNPHFTSWPLRYPKPQDLERAAPDPDKVARNMVNNAVYCGAKYITLTVFHSCEGLCILYPTRVPGFRLKTSLDYIGAFIRACTRKSIYPILYHSGGPWGSDKPGGPYLEERYADHASFAGLLTDMHAELKDLHGDAIAGFWIDGMQPAAQKLPAHIHKMFPNAVVIVNGPNSRDLLVDDIDYCTSEISNRGHFPELSPEYCRLDGFRDWPVDFNEDVPMCNGWWYYENQDSCCPVRWEFIKKKKTPYLADPNFLVRQMLTSLGQLRRWNYSLGIGPTVEGKMPDEFRPMLDRLHAFMEWGSQAVYDTVGGYGSCIRPGWMRDGGFCSVTVSMDNPGTHYLIVTTASISKDLRVYTNGYSVAKVADLRTGSNVPFSQDGFLKFNVDDWQDLEKYGAKVFKIDFVLS